MKELYNALTDGQKARILRLYIDRFGCSRWRFYRRINGDIVLNRAELHFFNQHLNPQS